MDIIDSKNYEIKKNHFKISKISNKNELLNLKTESFQSLDLSLREQSDMIESKRQIECLICGKIFTEKGNYSIHMRVHTQEKPFACPYIDCDETFKAHGHLKDHMKKHFNIKPYKCDLCSEKFSRQSTLKMHYYTHVQTKPFKCNYLDCDKYFVDKTQLKFHYKSHFCNESQEDFEKIFDEYFKKHLSSINKLLKLRDQEIEKTIKKNPVSINNLPKFIKRGNTYDIVYYENGIKIVDTTIDKDKIKDNNFLNKKKKNNEEKSKSSKQESSSKLIFSEKLKSTKKYFKGKNIINDNIHKRINEIEDDKIKFEELFKEPIQTNSNNKNNNFNSYIQSNLNLVKDDEEITIERWNYLSNLKLFHENFKDGNIPENRNIDINRYNFVSFIFLMRMTYDVCLNELLFEISNNPENSNCNHGFLRTLLNFINTYVSANLTFICNKIFLPYSDMKKIYDFCIELNDFKILSSFYNFKSFLETRYKDNFPSSIYMNSARSNDIYLNQFTKPQYQCLKEADDNIFNINLDSNVNSSNTNNNKTISGFKKLCENAFMIKNKRNYDSLNNNLNAQSSSFNPFKPQSNMNSMNRNLTYNQEKEGNFRTSNETMRKEKIIINYGKLLNTNHHEYDNNVYNFNSASSNISIKYDFGSKSDPNITNIFN